MKIHGQQYCLSVLGGEVKSRYEKMIGFVHVTAYGRPRKSQVPVTLPLQWNGRNGQTLRTLIPYQNTISQCTHEHLKAHRYGCTRVCIPLDFVNAGLHSLLEQVSVICSQATRPKAYTYYKRLSATDITSIASICCFVAVLCGHCSYISGLGEACSHAEASLFLVESNTQLQDQFSSKSLPCNYTL